MNDEKEDPASTPVPIDRGVFWVSLVVLLLFGGGLLFNPEASLYHGKKALRFLTMDLGWVYLWFTLFATLWLAWLAFGRFGKKRFGEEDSTPEYSHISWFGMLFCAGIGSNVLYFGTMEWMWYFIDPPPGVTKGTLDANTWATAYAFFHWGIPAWALYATATLPIAYVLHNKRASVLRISEACRGVLGKAVDGPAGTVIDILFIFGLVGGVGTSLGVGVPMISGVGAKVFGVTEGFALDAVILIGLTVVFAASVSMGLDKGIKVLSDMNVYLAFGLFLFILTVGPTGFIIGHAWDSVVLMLSEYHIMSLRPYDADGSTFAADFTVFYWAWWIAWAPFMGMFIARISRGRTIRQIVVGVVLGASAGCWVSFSILGNTAMKLMIDGQEAMTQLLAVETYADVNGPLAVVTLLESLPMPGFVLIAFFILAFLFIATSLDSAAFVLAATASKDLPPQGQPARWHRLMWAFLMAGMSLALLYLGDLEVLQVASVLFGFPVLVIMLIAAIALTRGLQADAKEKTKGTTTGDNSSA